MLDFVKRLTRIQRRMYKLIEHFLNDFVSVPFYDVLEIRTLIHSNVSKPLA